MKTPSSSYVSFYGKKVSNNLKNLYSIKDLQIIHKLEKELFQEHVSFLRSDYAVEKLAESFVTKNYLTAEDRKKIKVCIKKGKFTDAECGVLHGKYLLYLTRW